MRRALALAVVALALVAFVAVPAQAQQQHRITCVANGFVDITGTTGGPYGWHVAGTGPCLDSLQGNFLINFEGEGGSATLGFCDGLLVTGLQIAVHQNVLNLRTGEVTTSDQTWGAPLTTFPIATPFFIRQAGKFQGLGVMLTRILFSCPPGGNHVATFIFTTNG